MNHSIKHILYISNGYGAGFQNLSVYTCLGLSASIPTPPYCERPDLSRTIPPLTLPAPKSTHQHIFLLEVPSLTAKHCQPPAEYALWFPVPSP